MFDANSSIYDSLGSTSAANHYIICSTPRSGSTLLCRALWETGQAGFPHEYFHSAKHMPIIKNRWHTKDFDTYLFDLKKKRTTPNGFFGFKIHFQQFQQELHGKDLFNLFSNPKFIYIHRNDHLRQAISLARGIQTKQWSSDEIAQQSPVFDRSLIDNCLQRITYEEMGWENFFAAQDISPMRISYEHFVATYAETVRKVLHYIGVEKIQTIPDFPLQKLADHINDDWYDRYIAKRSKSDSFPIRYKKEVNTTPSIEQITSAPDISVLVFSYNFGHFIKDCIESILKQNLSPNEICIYDDFSTDNSWQIIESLCRQYPKRLRFHRNPKNLGMTPNVNYGMKRAKGEWITWIDGDDRWLPEKLMCEWNALNQSPNAKIAYSNVSMIDTTGKHLNYWDQVDCPQAPQGDIFTSVFSKKFFPNNGSVFRNHLQHRCVFDSLGYMDENLSLYIDWDFKIRATKCYYGAYNPNPMVEYRIHNGGIHNVDRKVHFEDVVAIFKKHVKLLKDIPRKEQFLILKSIAQQLNALNPNINPYTVLSPIAVEAGIGLTSEEGNFKSRLLIPGESARNQPQTNSRTSKSTQRTRQDEYLHRIKRDPLMNHSHLIFLISLPRSGSTLLQRILSGHIDIHTTAEPWLMLHPLHMFKADKIKSIYDQNLAASATQDFLSTIPENMELYYQAVRAYGLTLYNRALETSGKRLFLDKTPRYYSIIPELARTFPNSRFIILLRNPMAVLSSVFKTWCNNDPAKLTSTLNYRDLTDGPRALIEGINLLRDKAAVVHYEDLVSDPHKSINHICNFLNITFDNEMLEYGKRKPPKGKFGDTVGIYRHQRPVNENTNKWIANFSDVKLRTFATDYLYQLGVKTYTQLGYDFAAVESVIRSLNDHVDRATIPNEDTHSGSFLLSSRSFSKKKYDDVIGALQQAQPKTMIEEIHHFLNSYPDFPEAHNDLGVLYCNMNEHAKALKHYRKAVSIDSQNITFQKNLADFLFIIKNDIQGALKIYTALLALRPKDTELLYAIGQVSLSLGKSEDAKIFFKRILNIEPNNILASQALNSSYYISYQSEVYSVTEKFKVSAVVSTYASESFIEGRLQNLVEQTLFKKGDLEIIVVDSNSPENERAVVDKYCAQHSNIRYLRTMERETVYTAWNRGIELSHGTYFVNANTDDRFSPDALEVMADALDTHPSFGAAYGNWVVTRTPNDTFESSTPKRLFIYPEFHPGLFFYLQITSHANFVRRSVIDKIGQFDGAYTVFGDREFMLRFSASGFKALKLDKIVGLYLENPTSVERANRDIGKQECTALYDTYLAPERFATLIGYDIDIHPEKLSAAYTESGCFGMGLYHINGRPAHALGSPTRLFAKAIELDPANVEALNNMGVIAQHRQAHKNALSFFENAKALANDAQIKIIDHNKKMVCRGITDPNQLQFLFPSDFHAIRVVESKYNSTRQNPKPAINKFTKSNTKKSGRKRQRRKKSEKNILSSSISKKPASLSPPTGVPSVDDMIWPAWADYLKEDYPSALASLHQLLSDDPDLWVAYELLVDILHQSGHADEIVAQIHTLEKRKGLPDRMLALIGCGYEAADNLEKAEGFADQALTSDAECARAWNLKGVIAYRNGYGSEAAQFFQKAAECDENWGDPWTNMGTLHWENGTHDKALSCLETGFQLSPTAPNVATTYHLAISDTEQYERSRNIFEDVVTRHPDFRKGRFLLIDILIRLEAYQEALDQIEIVVVRFGLDSQLLKAAKVVRAKIGPMTTRKGKRPSLSLCMIVKNEAQNLPRCLENLKPLVDEMIVVDTGSTDATRDIAEIFGAKVFGFKWNDDFAAARNHCLDQATGDWILVMDADEIIAPKDHKELKNLIKKSQKRKIAYTITTRNYTRKYNSIDWKPNDGTYGDQETGCGWIPSTKTRLFRNTAQIRFEYPVHELVDPALNRHGYQIKQCKVPVHHYGILDKSNANQKGRYYYKIGKRKLKQMKNDPNAIHELAVGANTLGDHQEAIKLWKRAAEIQPNNVRTFINLAAAYGKLGDYEKAKSSALTSVKIDAHSKQGHYNLGRSEFFLGNFIEAKRIFEKIVCNDQTYYSANFMLGATQICCGNHKEGLESFLKFKSLIIWDSLPHAFQELAQTLYQAGFPQQANELVLFSNNLEADTTQCAKSSLAEGDEYDQLKRRTDDKFSMAS